MVLGIITAAAACPAIVGTNEAVQQGQRQNARDRHRGTKTNLIVACSTASRLGREINGCRVVLSDEKLWIAVPTEEFPDGRPEDHPFTGYFLPFPEHNWGRPGEGLVSTISDDPPQLNWIYVDKVTYEVKYGLRVEAEPHIVGPWDVTKVDRRLTLDGWEGFMAVKYGEGDWALYFDEDDDGLKDIIEPQYERVPIELVRKELKQAKPVPEASDEQLKASEKAKGQQTSNEDEKGERAKEEKPTKSKKKPRKLEIRH